MSFQDGPSSDQSCKRRGQSSGLNATGSDGRVTYLDQACDRGGTAVTGSEVLAVGEGQEDALAVTPVAFFGPTLSGIGQRRIPGLRYEATESEPEAWAGRRAGVDVRAFRRCAQRAARCGR